MANNTPKLLSARPRVSAALMNAAAAQFGQDKLAQQGAVDQSGQPNPTGPKKKKRGPIAAALANFKGSL